MSGTDAITYHASGYAAVVWRAATSPRSACVAAMLAAGGCAVTAGAELADRPPVLLVRLRPRLPGGVVVGESRRVCHLVPVPRPGAVPEVLSAYCGVVIAPGTAELLATISGMPCEACLAQSPIPVFALLRGLPIAKITGRQA